MRKSWPIAVLVSFGASMCCIGPALAALTGLSILGTAAAWISPWRYPLIGIAIITLGFGWFQFWRQRRIACDCEEPRPRPWGLIGVTLVALGFLAYPALAEFGTPASTSKSTTEVERQKISLSVKGMTCRACAHEIDKAVAKLPGVRHVVTNYEENRTEVEMDSSQSRVKEVTEAIRNLGYESVLIDTSNGGAQ